VSLAERPFARRAAWGAVGVAVLVLILLTVLVLLILNPDDTGPTGANTSRHLEPVTVITGPNTGDKPLFARPLAAAWASDGSIYVSDTGNGRVCVFSSRGKFIREVGRATTSTPVGQRAGALVQPAGLAVRADGSLLVADLRAGVVREYDVSGRFMRSIHPRAVGSAVAPAWSPTDVALFGDSIYVADAKGIAVFSATGKLIRRYDRVTKESAFARPASVAVLRDGTLVVSDTNARRVVALTKGGLPVWSVPRVANTAQDSVFGLPRGVAAVGDGSVVVVDAFKFGFVHISADGRVLGSYGARGIQPGFFEFPNDVDVRDDLVLVADKENDRVQVVRLRGILNATTDPKR